MRALLLLVLGALPLMAAFPHPSQTIKLDAAQKEAVLVFQADSGIQKAKPLCECTKVSLSGSVLTAHVDVSGFTRTVSKYIDATTADGVTTRLTMHFEAPVVVQLSAQSLIWKLGAPASPQELRISIPDPAHSPVHDITEAAISGEAFDYTPRIVKKGKEYAVSVTPRSTEKKALNRLIIKTDSADPRYAQYIVYLSVQP